MKGRVLKKFDIIIIAAAVLTFIAVFCIIEFAFPTNSSQVKITVGDEEPVYYPLSENRTIEIERGECLNIIEINDNTVKMKYSTCKNQICVEHEALSADTADDSSTPIVCLPNRITVELV